MIRPPVFAATLTVILLAGCQSANPAAAMSAGAGPGIPVSSAIPEGEDDTPPAAWVDFCRRAPAQCAASRSGPERVTLDAAGWTMIDSVNRSLNTAIRPMIDADHYGKAEFWTLVTDGFGDCEDSALTKRDALAGLGLPLQALRMAVVIDTSGERHAVLTIATNRGDYVLDNLSDDILPWTRSGYIWLTRQAPEGGMAWVKLNAMPAVSRNERGRR